MSTMEEAFEDLFDQRTSVEEAVDRHFAPSFRQRVDGVWGDRAGFIAGIGSLRTAVEHATITVLDELTDGKLYADRHRVDLIRRDGEQIHQEVYVFAERDADGRFLRIEEATLKTDLVT